MSRSPHALARPLAGLALALSLAACDDPAEMAREVVQARGECDQDSLRASSEACVRMFERYGEMATEAIHTYIGGMKAMDAALDRMPPPNFDTAGLGHAISPPGDGPPGYGPGAPYPAAEPYPGRSQGEGPRWEPYADEWAEPAPARPGPPTPPRRGVLRPPEERLRRPWLEPREEAPGDDLERPDRPERPERRPYDYDVAPEQEPAYGAPRSRPSLDEW